MVRVTVKKLQAGTNAGRYGVRDDGVTMITFHLKGRAEAWATARRRGLKLKIKKRRSK